MYAYAQSHCNGVFNYYSELNQDCVGLSENALRHRQSMKNGLDQSAGLKIQSSPNGFGLDWIVKPLI